MGDKDTKFKNFEVTIKDISAEEPRTLLIVGSTEKSDRDGDVILSSGWDLVNYTKNPVVLWAHNHYEPPIARAKAVWIDIPTKALVFKIYFPTIDELSTKGAPPSDHALFVDAIYNMYKNGLLSAVSVGFRGKKFEPRKDQDDLPMWARGLLFSEQELIELSAVPVPANADALVQARSAKSYNDKALDLIETEYKRMLTEQEKARNGEGAREEGEEGTTENTLTPEDVQKLKAFLATLTSSDGTNKKSGARLSKATRERLDKAINHAGQCSKELQALVDEGEEVLEGEGAGSSDGVEPKGAGCGEGDEKPKAEKKAPDLATMTVEEADNILRQESGNHEGA